jgi:hypothetical protein
MDAGQTPAHFEVLVLFDEADGFDLARARQLLAERVAAVRRLRQRLIRTPLGCGGPIWVDDEGGSTPCMPGPSRWSPPWAPRPSVPRRHLRRPTH